MSSFGLIAMILGAFIVYEAWRSYGGATAATASSATVSPASGTSSGSDPLANLASLPATWANGLRIIIAGESGGNVNANSADNPNDPNTLAGNPTIGLTQQLPDNAIPGTYGQSSIGGYPAPLYTGGVPTRYGFNLLDPTQNIEAAVAYIKQRYGDISQVPGVRAVLGGQPYQAY